MKSPFSRVAPIAAFPPALLRTIGASRLFRPWHLFNEVIATSADLARLFRGGVDTHAGIDVNPTTALNLSTVMACRRVLSEDIAKLPLILYRRDADDPRHKARATDHPLYRLLRDSPNDWQTAFEFREMMQGHALLTGNAYAFINRVRGEVVELIPLDPTTVTVRQDPDFTVHYTVNQRERGPRELGVGEILHVRGLSSDGFTGISVVANARESIGLGLATEKFGARFFGRGARPGLVLTHPQTLADTALEHLKESLDQDYKGDNAFRSLVLEEGMKMDMASLSNEDSQFLETRKFQVTEVARWFRVPPHKVGDLERATFSNIEMQSIEYVTDTLMPWAVRWEQAIDQALLPDPDEDDLFVEFLFDALLRGTAKERNESDAIAVQNGWKTRNEVRAQNNMNPGPRRTR